MRVFKRNSERFASWIDHPRAGGDVSPVRIVSGIAVRLRQGLAVGALLIGALVTSGVASAKDACPLQTLYALSQASLLPADAEVPLVAEACKVWPYDDSLALAAIAYPLPASDENGRVLRLVIAVLGARESDILAVHETDLTEDAGFALLEDGLKLDTARYDLAKGVRAFGVVVRSSAPGPSCPDRRLNDALTLYVREGEALRPVFASYTDFWARVEGEPCSWAQDQPLVTEEAAFTIGMERSAHKGFADLRVTATVARIESAASSDQEQVKRRRASRIVRYDGARYDVDPLENGFFWIQGPEGK